MMLGEGKNPSLYAYLLASELKNKTNIRLLSISPLDGEDGAHKSPNSKDWLNEVYPISKTTNSILRDFLSDDDYHRAENLGGTTNSQFFNPGSSPLYSIFLNEDRESIVSDGKKMWSDNETETDKTKEFVKRVLRSKYYNM